MSTATTTPQQDLLAHSTTESLDHSSSHSIHLPASCLLVERCWDASLVEGPAIHRLSGQVSGAALDDLILLLQLPLLQQLQLLPLTEA